MLAGGVPCSPFSKAGKQLGAKDERDLFPQAFRLADKLRPQVMMLENVRGFLDPVFENYRYQMKTILKKLGYFADYRLFNAADFGVSQCATSSRFSGFKKRNCQLFFLAGRIPAKTTTVGYLLFDLMTARAWKGAQQWSETAHQIAPTLVGGSRKHGGADLGPSRAKRAGAAPECRWAWNR